MQVFPYCVGGYPSTRGCAEIRQGTRFQGCELLHVHSYYVVQLYMYMYITETMLMNDHIVHIYTRTFSSHIFVYKMYFNASCHLNHLFCSQSIYLHVHCIITKSA